MALFAAIAGHCRRVLTNIVREPAQSLTSFMDGVDEIWLVDAFMDQPETADRRV